jgi:hypothetical protein
MEFGETMTGEQENVHKSLSTCTETVIVDGLMKYRVVRSHSVFVNVTTKVSVI